MDGALEDKRKGTLKLLQDGFDKCGEAETRTLFMFVPDVLCEDRNRLGIGLRLEDVTAFLENETEFARVGDDTIVDDGKFVSAKTITISQALAGDYPMDSLGIRTERMAVDGARRTVGSPASMGDGDLGDEGLGLVDWVFVDELLQTSDLADLLEEDDFARLVTVDTTT